jgi:hypothetical protein
MSGVKFYMILTLRSCKTVEKWVRYSKIIVSSVSHSFLNCFTWSQSQNHVEFDTQHHEHHTRWLPMEGMGFLWVEKCVPIPYPPYPLVQYPQVYPYPCNTLVICMVSKTRRGQSQMENKMKMKWKRKRILWRGNISDTREDQCLTGYGHLWYWHTFQHLFPDNIV